VARSSTETCGDIRNLLDAIGNGVQVLQAAKAAGATPPLLSI